MFTTFRLVNPGNNHVLLFKVVPSEVAERALDEYTRAATLLGLEIEVV